MAKPRFDSQYPSFSRFDAIALRRLAEACPPNFRIAEVGSWLGQGSTQVLIDVARRRGGEVYCVDTWRGNHGVQRHQDIVRDYDVFGTFQHNVAAAGGVDVVRALVMSSSDAARVVGDELFDLVFLDADHSYQATLDDVCCWMPKVKKGGVLCGHDCEARPEDFDRATLLAGRHLDTIPGNTRFTHVHAGVILALETALRGRHRLWSDEELEAEDGECGRSTIWSFEVAASDKSP